MRWRADPRAGSAERWTQTVTAAGLDPATLVDWLPHLDPYTLAALRDRARPALVLRCDDPSRAIRVLVEAGEDPALDAST